MDSGGLVSNDEMTKKFCLNIIENTMESLRGFNNGEIGDD